MDGNPGEHPGRDDVRHVPEWLVPEVMHNQLFFLSHKHAVENNGTLCLGTVCLPFLSSPPEGSGSHPGIPGKKVGFGFDFGFVFSGPSCQQGLFDF